MIQVFDPPAGVSAESALERLVFSVEPSSREVARLTEEFQLPAEFVRHCLDRGERPHAEKLGNSYLAVFRIPCAEPPGAPAPYATVPLGTIMTEDEGAILCARETRLVQILKDKIHAPGSLRKRSLLLGTLRLAAEIFLADLETINRNVDTLEDRLRESLENREVLEILRHQKSLVYFSTALEANLLLLERLQRDTTLPVLEGDIELLDDALVETRQALDVARLSRDILSEMMDAFASIISNNLNNVMRFLAAVTVVLTVPILIASFWGMNVGLPLDRTPHGFGLLVVLSLLLSLALVIAFRRRRWL